MKSDIKRVIGLMGLAALISALPGRAFVSSAATTSFFQALNAGAATVLDGESASEEEVTEPRLMTRESQEVTETDSLTERLQELDESITEQEETEYEEPDEEEVPEEVPERSVVSKEEALGNKDLVMANVQDAVNVRSEPSEESDKLGKLYRDCAGEVIERRDGWTRLKSGSLEGWTKDEYLYFGDEAREMAMQVGNLVAMVNGDALRVRRDTSESSAIMGLVSKGQELNALDVVNDEWVRVEYEGEEGYVKGEFTVIHYVLDKGETMQQIKAREDKEAEEKKAVEKKKAELNKNRGAVAVDASDDVLLAALIQCEAGNQPYEGQLAVGAVVMNRVRSGGYPSTVSGVIYASGQFTPARNGRVASAIASGVKASCLQAAQAAIAGQSNVGGATHFRRAGSQQGVVIGDHVFW